MRVVLIQPRTPSAALDYRYRGEHIGLSSLVAVLLNAGHDAIQLDDALDKRDLKDTIALLQRLSPDFIGVTVPSQTATGRVIEYLVSIKETFSETPLSIGGIFATVAFEDFMKKCPEIDYLMRGEGEVALPRLLEALSGRDELTQVPGLVYRLPDGTIQHNSIGPSIDVASLPRVDRGTINPLLAENRRVALYAGRGCYGECTFCSLHAFWGESCVRKRAPEDVVEEMIMLFDMGAKKLRFIDDIFLDGSASSKRWLDEFEKLLGSEKRDFNLWMQFRAQDVDVETLRRLKALGLKKLLIGAESGDQLSLDAMHKRTTVKQNMCAVKKAVAVDVKEIAIGFIMFHPDSTFESVKNNLAFLKMMPTFRYKNLFSKASAYRGTMMHSMVVESGLERPKKHWYDLTDYSFKDFRVQKLWDYSQQLRRCFAHCIWFETTLDVEERFIKGTGRRFDEQSELLKMKNSFRKALSKEMLDRFVSILSNIGKDLAPDPQCFEVPNSLLTPIVRMQELLPVVQHGAGLEMIYHLPEGAIEEILKL